MTLPFKLVSADSHIAEPGDLWIKRIDRRFLDRAPRILTTNEGDFFVIDGKTKILEDSPGDGIGLLATKRKYADPEGYDFGFNGIWSDVPEAAYDPAERIREIDREGIEAELIYTSFGLGMFALPDLEYRRACMIAFNDWLAEFCAASSKRLFGIAMLPTDDIDRDVAEMTRCAKLGMKGAMISISQDSNKDYSDPSFEKLWSAAEELEMPISLHVAASETTFMATGNMWADFACVFTPTMYSIVTMLFSGIFDRHPGLKVVSVENDASWPLPVLERMDDRWLHDRKWAWGDAMSSGRKPSEIFHDHVSCTFMRDRTAILNREIIGRKNIMWGSDYPHFDGAWPASGASLASQFAGVPIEDQRLIGRENAIALYKLPLEA